MKRQQFSLCTTTRVMSRVWLFALIGVASTLGSGCFHGVPITMEQVKPNEVVDVQLTDAAATRLTKDLGFYTSRIQGPVKAEVGDSISIAIQISREFSGVSLENSRLDLFLARSEVTGVRRRQLSRARTTFATIGSVVLFGVVVGTVAQLTDPNKPTNEELPPPPPVGNRFGFRFSFR